MVAIVSMMLLLAFTGLDIVTAFSAVVASINNTGPGWGWSGRHPTTRARFPDLGLHLCHAARASGDIHLAGGADAGVLAEITRGLDVPGSAHGRTRCEVPAEKRRKTLPSRDLPRGIPDNLPFRFLAELTVSRPKNDTFCVFR